MAKFSDLPNELIMGIWGYVLAPEDVESFALASKTVYGLSKPFVTEHAKLKKRYSIQVLSIWGEKRPADLLMDLMLKPRIALYVRRFHVDDWAPCWEEEDYVYDWAACSEEEDVDGWAAFSEEERYIPRKSLTADTIELLRDGVRCSSVVEISELGNWIAAIELGDEDPIIALILMRLTRLKKLELHGQTSGTDPYILKALGRIAHLSDAANYHERLRGLNSEGNNNGQPTFLNIRVLALGLGDINFDLFSRLLRSMRNLEIFTYIERESTFCGNNGHILRSHILQSLGDVLPISIKGVVLFLFEEFAFETLERLASDMVKSKVARLPNLTALVFEASSLDEPDIFELNLMFHGKYREVGVLFDARISFPHEF